MIAVIGEREAATALADGLCAQGVEARSLAPEPVADSSAVASLAAALTELEARLESERPDLVVVADASDAALAGVLVATKLVIPVEAVAEAREPDSANGRLIAQLAAART